MAKRSSARRPGTQSGGAATAAEDVPVVGPREPCPCGSGKRYKLCHGRAARAAATEIVRRPFQGLPGEADWVCLREVVPAATATLRTTAEHGGLDVTLATVLPLAWPGLHRADGERMVGLQAAGSSGDPSRDLAAALLAVLASEPGAPLEQRPDVTPATPRLQDVLDVSRPLDVRVHEGFDYWVPDGAEAEGEVAESLQRASESVVPTERLSSVEGAYWCRIGERTHLRWAMTHDEDPLLDALARLHAAGRAGLGEGTKYVGAFRAQGLVVPVWDLAPGAVADDVEEPAAAFRSALDEVLASPQPLTADERRARAGVVSRQLTLR
ncbi:DUF5926 family protein [uncultured Pseudokineococcus sp.]|uniref:DUF5926 family protein n=1 Tax=uncultured Pseudokineococcus sp. TaxID=1642928 RepID=UPI00261B08A1|nr:DUF5926 family protein [uncultured Pseudokineococcus sp.]